MKNLILSFVAALILSLQLSGQDFKVEAESGNWTPNLRVTTARPGYSGTGYVTQFTNASDKLTLSAIIPAEGVYDIYIGYNAEYGSKIINVEINDIKSATEILQRGTSFSEVKFGTLKLKADTADVIITPNWTWFHIDYVRFVKVTDENQGFNIPQTPINPNATAITRNLYSFLLDNFRKRIISGVMTLKSLATNTNETLYLKSVTGKEPALLGLDFMDHTGSTNNYKNNPDLVKDAKNWANRNGIVAICWHWRDPSFKSNAFYTKDTGFDISKVNDPESSEYKAMIRDIDIVSGYLKELQAANVPVLWRPLHEAAGAWFWWGAKGAGPCVKLWRLMYDRMTNYHGLNNLIWVWTTTDDSRALTWYPGDEYVDILGMDIYPGEREHGSQVIAFSRVKEIFKGKRIIALSENGSIPYPELMERDGAYWSYFMPWYGEHTKDARHNSTDEWKKIMSADYVITLDEMPRLATYTSASRISGDLRFKNEIKIFKTNGNFHFTIPAEGSDKFRIRLISLTGELIREEYAYPKNLVTLPADGLTKGIYLVELTGSGQRTAFKVLN
jgi:mannan endo-1,4-beta-mannosidase